MNEQEIKIYELAQKFKFEELNEASRNFVLLNYSKEEYNRIYTMLSGIKESVKDFDADISAPDVLNKINKRIVRPQAQTTLIWRAAAILFLLVNIALIYSQFSKKSSTEVAFVNPGKSETILNQITDTVFVIRDKVVYKDSIIYKESKMAYNTINEKKADKAIKAALTGPPDFAVLTEGEIEKKIPDPVSISMAEDTISKLIGFVSL